MIRNFEKLINTDVKKRLFSNFVSLSVLQIANLILPLITFPYLVRVLGIEKYGLILFAQAFMMYFVLIADYGFNLSGTREIAQNRSNRENLIDTYNSILLARLGLVFLGFLFMSIIVLSFERFALDWVLYFLSFGSVLGTALFPIWFFQGIQEMRYITVLSVIAKSIFTISIFIIVKLPQDYLWVPFLNSLGHVVIGFISLIIINKKIKIPFRIQSIKNIQNQLKIGWYIFISNISINIFTATTTVVLGLVTNNTMVGYYAIAEKVIRVIQGLFSPISQTIYPHMVELSKKSPRNAMKFARNVLKYILFITIGVFLVGVIFTVPIFQFVFGNDVAHSILLFRLLSPLIIILPIATILFNVVLLSFNMDVHFFKIYVTGAILNVFLLGIFLFGLELSTIGASISLLISEGVVVIYAAMILYNHNVILQKLIVKKKQ